MFIDIMTSGLKCFSSLMFGILLCEMRSLKKMITKVLSNLIIQYFKRQRNGSSEVELF